MNLVREGRLVAAGFALAAFAVPWLCVCLEQSLRQGLNPANWFVVLRGLHLYFIPVAILVALPQLAIVHVLFYHHEWWAFALAGYAFFSIHALIGRLLFYSRKGLNLYTERSPEQDVEHAAREHETVQRELWNELHILTSSRRIQQAYEKLDTYIDGRYREQDPVVHERLKDLQDKRLLLQHGVYYLQRLLDRKQNEQAWLLFKQCLAFDARFRPLSAEAFMQCTLGATRADAALVNDLLADFDRAYPDSSVSPSAQYRRSRVLLELLNQPAEARQVLKALSQTHPDFVATPRVQAYVKSLLG